MKFFKKAITLCLASVIALGVLVTAGCSGIDRTQISTFFSFRPNTIFVYEHSIGGGTPMYMFFEHIEGDTAQQVTIWGGSEVVENLLFIDDALLRTNVGMDINRGNYLEAYTTHLSMLLNGPLEVGKTWWNYSFEGGHNFTLRIESLNSRVRVPYGRFRALEVRGVNWQGVGSSITSFYAPGVGLVKQVTEQTNAAGNLVRSELVLVDIIENAGLEETIAIFFPNNGEVEAVHTVVTHYTNNNALETYFEAANEVWADAFGFTVDPSWFNRAYEMAIWGLGTQRFLWLDFNEQFLQAMNNVADAETEELILLSVAATLSGMHRASPARSAAPYSNGEVFLTINGDWYASNRIELAPGERIVIFENIDVYFPNDGDIAVTHIDITHRNRNVLETNLNALNEIWADVFGFEVDASWISRVYETPDEELGISFLWLDFNEQFLAAMNGAADAETEELILFSIAATFSGMFETSPARSAADYSNSEVYITINGVSYASNRVTMEPGERVVIFGLDLEWDNWWE